MLNKFKHSFVSEQELNGFVAEAERMVNEYGWHDRNVYPYSFPMKVTQIISDIKDYYKCTEGTKEYLVSLANGFADVLNAWEQNRLKEENK